MKWLHTAEVSGDSKFIEDVIYTLAGYVCEWVGTDCIVIFWGNCSFNYILYKSDIIVLVCVCVILCKRIFCVAVGIFMNLCVCVTLCVCVCVCVWVYFYEPVHVWVRARPCEWWTVCQLRLAWRWVATPQGCAGLRGGLSLISSIRPPCVMAADPRRSAGRDGRPVLGTNNARSWAHFLPGAALTLLLSDSKWRWERWHFG